MKRKLIYTIIFISIFLMSSASMVRPVQGYEPPDIPSEAKGMTLDDTEVTIYDEDEMEKSLGRGFDIKDIKDGDADIVGARSQMKIIDWETDEDLIKYEKVWVYEAVEFETAADGIRVVLWDLGNITQQAAGVAPIIELIKQITGALGTIEGVVVTAAVAADTLADTSISSWDDLMVLYSDKYDGTILEREVWDFLDPAEEFDPKADTDDDEVPYLLDPRDWVDSYYNVRALATYIDGVCNSIQAELDTWYGALYQYYGANYTAINATMDANFIPELKWVLNNITEGMGMPYPDYVLSSYILATYVVNNIKYSTAYSVPDKFGYLLQLLEAGQPCCGPAADFIKKAVEEFNIRERPYKIPFIQYGEDWLGLLGAPGADGEISPIPVGTMVGLAGNIPMGGETIYLYAEVDIEVDDAGVVTIEFEYAKDQQDPRDAIKNEKYHPSGGEDDPDELDDWEWIFPKAGDGPTQMKSGDTIFYQTDPMEGPIPGYETPVILGVALVSVIGLIYVVMRKRKR